MMMTARCTYLTVHLVRYAMLVLTAKDSVITNYFNNFSYYIPLTLLYESVVYIYYIYVLNIYNMVLLLLLAS